MAKKDILLNGVIVGAVEATGDNEKDAETAQQFLKDKGLYKEITTNDAMYGQANSFAEVANYIYKTDLKTSPYKGSSTPPFIVNGVLSIELYLKAIHNAYGNTVKGHHLANLYKGMPNKGKAFFDQASVEIRPRYQLIEGEDIYSCLTALSKAFEEWRYLYEHDGMGTELQSIRYTMHVAHEACCRVRESVAET